MWYYGYVEGIRRTKSENEQSFCEWSKQTPGSDLQFLSGTTWTITKKWPELLAQWRKRKYAR